MEDDALITGSNEYRLLEAYYQKRRKSSIGLESRVCMFRCSAPTTTTGDATFGNVAEKLSRIVDSRPVADGLAADRYESDCETDVVQRLVELLKESGDELNEKIQRNHELVRYLQSSFTYSLFDRLATAFIDSVVPNQSTKNREQIAMTFEVTSRLKALDLHPMNRVMGFGAKYLQKHFTPWVQQHGGWEKAFEDDDDEEVH